MLRRSFQIANCKEGVYLRAEFIFCLSATMMSLKLPVHALTGLSAAAYTIMYLRKDVAL